MNGPPNTPEFTTRSQAVVELPEIAVYLNHLNSCPTIRNTILPASGTAAAIECEETSGWNYSRNFQIYGLPFPGLKSGIALTNRSVYCLNFGTFHTMIVLVQKS